VISIAHPDFRTDLRREFTSIRRVVLPDCNYR
jgi:acyl-CoA hydrolase